MSTDTTDTDEAQLKKRIAELEKQVKTLRSSIGISRREALAGLGVAGVGGLLGNAAVDSVTDPVAAKTNAGDVGTASNPVDIFASHIQLGSDLALISKPASGQVALSSGKGVVDTGLSATDATFYLALGVDDPNADAKITGRLFWDDSAGTYKIEIVEDGTNVGNPTVNYDVLRVR